MRPQRSQRGEPMRRWGLFSMCRRISIICDGRLPFPRARTFDARAPHPLAGSVYITLCRWSFRPGKSARKPLKLSGIRYRHHNLTRVVHEARLPRV